MSALLLMVACGSHSDRPKPADAHVDRAAPAKTNAAPKAEAVVQPATTNVYMHNVRLRRAPNLQLAVKWLRGELLVTNPKNPASLDNDNSFSIRVKDGELALSLEDLSRFAQKTGIASGNLSHIQLMPQGGDLIVKARYRGIFPIRITGTVSAAPNAQVRVHIAKISLLSIPMKGLLQALDVKPADLLDPAHMKGIRVEGDDMLIDGSQLLSPPSIGGNLRQVRIAGGDLVEVYGDAGPEVLKREQWRNYVSLKGGTLGFARLLMDDTDMMMIDTSADQWFDLDIDHYQTQMVNGYIRLTPDAGLQIFMPDEGKVQKAGARFNLDWLKHRNQAPPPDVMPH